MAGDATLLLSHLLWRETDTHDAVRDALAARFRWKVDEMRAVMRAALPESRTRVICQFRYQRVIAVASD